MAKIPRNDSDGRYYELHLDWPESSLLKLNSRPQPCLPNNNEALTRHIIFSNSCKSKITEVLLPSTIMVGEWLYWNNIPSPHPKSLKSQTKNYHSFRFEGPEKKFELNYKPIPGDSKGLRVLGSEEWQEILNHGHLLILSEKKNELFDSYLLSESSLFVYPYKVIIKTCGISSPLLCTKALRETATKLGTEIESVVFSRRSFICPLGQCYPHRSIEEELHFLTKNFPGGESLKLGDPTSDHWFLYASKLSPDAKFDSTPSLEVTMTGRMKPEALKLFWRDENVTTGSVAEKTGFAELTKGAEIDEYSFTPCGFSYNGLQDQGFVTVHITPELPLCYISFETTIQNLDYENIIKKLISTFEPAHYTALILNNGGNTTNVDGYKITHQNKTKMGGVPVTFERRKKAKKLIELY